MPAPVIPGRKANGIKRKDQVVLLDKFTFSEGPFVFCVNQRLITIVSVIAINYYKLRKGNLHVVKADSTDRVDFFFAITFHSVTFERILLFLNFRTWIKILHSNTAFD